MKKAFTLIELLVVIAIIAILAAILFPVFAQAKTAAKKTVALSNCKEIGLAFVMYTGDYDDTTPKLGGCQVMSDGQYHGIDYTDQLLPYTKSEQLYQDPTRNDYDSGIPSYDKTDEPKGKYAGFGYNWGPILRRGGGMLGRQIVDPNYTGDYSSGPSCIFSTGKNYIPGVNQSAILSPADMFAFSVSRDTPRITMGIDFLLCTWRGFTQATLPYGGNWPVAFADGHAKAMTWKFGFGDPAAESGLFAVPSNTNLITDYCADPSFSLNSTTWTGSPDGDWVPDGTLCSQLPALFAALPYGPYSSSSTTPTFGTP